MSSARAYFEYGNALLIKEEENPSHGLLGNVDGSDNQGGDAPNANSNEEGGEENDDDADEDGGDAEGEEQEEIEDDLQIAWEVLDVSTG